MESFSAGDDGHTDLAPLLTTTNQPSTNIPAPDKPTLQSLPGEIRWSIFYEPFADGELRLGHKDGLKIAGILDSCKTIRQELIPMLHDYCTISWTQGRRLPYFPSYLDADDVRHVALYVPPELYQSSPSVRVLFPRLESFKVIFKGRYYIDVSDRISKMAHQMASMNPSKKQLLTYLLCMMSDYSIRRTITHAPSHNSTTGAAPFDTDIYEIPFRVRLASYDDPYDTPYDESDDGTERIHGVSLPPSMLLQCTDPNAGLPLRC